MGATASPAPAPMTPTESLALLTATRRSIHTLLEGLDDQLLRYHPAPGEWCMLELLGHLVAADEHAFAGRIAAIFEGDGSGDRAAIGPFDADAHADRREDCSGEVHTLLEEVERSLADRTAILTRLTAEDLDRVGVHHAVGEVTVGDFVREWPYHDADHLRQMLANLQSALLPGFSDGFGRAIAGTGSAA